MRWWYLSLIGFAAYLFFLSANLPADYAIDWLESGNPAISIRGSAGTVWKGEAEEASFNTTPLGSVKWRFTPLGLLGGQLKYRLELSDPGQNLTGFAAMNIITGQYLLSGLQGRISAEIIPSLVGQSSVQTRGNVEVDIEKLGFSQQKITSALGNIRWIDATVQSPINVELGNLQFNLTSDASSVKTTIKDLAGPLKVDGEIVLSPDMTYRIQGKIKPASTSDTGLANMLRSIGRPGAEGSTLIDYSGQL